MKQACLLAKCSVERAARGTGMTHYVGDRGVAETTLANGRGHALEQPSAKLGGRGHVLGAHNLVACGSHSRRLSLPAIEACTSWYAGVPLTSGAPMNTSDCRGWPISPRCSRRQGAGRSLRMAPARPAGRDRAAAAVRSADGQES